MAVSPSGDPAGASAEPTELRGRTEAWGLAGALLLALLVAIGLWLRLRGGALAPEALTRLPSAVAGGLTVLAVALLGRRLFGRAAGLVAASLLAVSTTAIG